MKGQILPWVESDGDEILVLDVNATEDEVEGGLGSAVGADGPRNVLGAGDGSDTRRDDGEFGLLRSLQQWQNSLEEPDWTVDVDIDVLDQVGGLGHGNLKEGLRLEDAGIGDDHVEVGDALVLDGGDGVCCVGLGSAVDLDCDELGALSLGDVDEIFGVLAIGVTSSSDDGGVGSGQVLFDEAAAKALQMHD